MPLVSAGDVVDIRNNIFYNWGNNSAPLFNGTNNGEIGSPFGTPGTTANLVKNYWKAGPNSGTSRVAILRQQANGTRIFVENNFGPLCPTGCANDWDNRWRDGDKAGDVKAAEADYRLGTPRPAPSIIEDDPGDLIINILPTVGAYKPSRDSVDTRITNDIRNGTGNIQNIGAGGPWPVLGQGTYPQDTDGDAMPDSWELSNGLNPNNACDGPATAANGYTYVENYLNELAGDPIPGSISNPPSTPSPPTNLRIMTN